MKILYIFCVSLTLLVPLSKSTEVRDYDTLEKPNRLFKKLHNCRKTRDADEEDVINRFEMERVSPLYDILRHLPAFEDGWLPNPVTSPTFPSPPPIRLNNESSSYGEFKIELSKDEEHVVSESGRGFQENSALNWYYSAESYSSVNNFSRSNINKPQLQITTPGVLKTDEIFSSSKTTDLDESIRSVTTKFDEIVRSKTTKLDETSSPKTTKLEEVFSPKSMVSRKLDEEHVVSHVPSLKGGRGAFLDFNLLESSTTPKVEATLSSKTEEPKPNITTRYILLQSGRVVAINVTSVSPVLKPSSSSGSSNKNPYMPTFYFGSRIRNKNATSPVLNDTQRQSVLSTVKPGKVVSTIQTNTKLPTDFKKTDLQKVSVVPIVKPPIEIKNKTNDPVKKRTFVQPISIKPFVEYVRSKQSKNNSLTDVSEPMKQTPETNKTQQVVKVSRSQKLKQTPDLNKSEKLKDHPVTKNPQYSKDFLPTTKVPLFNLRETNPADPADKWWKEMKAARLLRTSQIVTTSKPKVSTVSSRNALQSLVNVFHPSTDNEQNVSKSFHSLKKLTEDRLTHPTIELATNSRSGKSRLTEKNALLFSTTPIAPKTTKASDVAIRSKSTKSWTTFESGEVRDVKRNDILTSTTEEDILEPPVPLTNVQHDFARIVTVPPPVTQSADFKSPISSIAPAKENKGSSRRPRYRGLSHVNLQAPIKQQIQSSTVPPRYQVSTQAAYQLTTVPPRRTASHFGSHRENILHSSTYSNQPEEIPTPAPPRRSRNGFYLRNSVSFQTSPPGSLTDRRTLTTGKAVETSTTLENLQPPLDDLLIISFEPTRKTMKEILNATGKHDKIIRNEEKPRNYRIPSRKENPFLEPPPLSTAKPQARVIQKSYNHDRSAERTQSRSDSGSRVGRHFRTNSSKFQSLAERVESTSPVSVTTKQPFRVYYFEPKRKKSKNSDDALESKAPNTPLKNNEKSTRTNVERVQPTVNRGDSPFRERNRNFHNYEAPTDVQKNPRPTNSRSPKQLQPLVRDRSSTTEVVTTPRPAAKKLKSSPFIWHRPNVGLHKKTSQDDTSASL